MPLLPERAIRSRISSNFAFENQVLHGRSIEQEVGNGRALAVFLDGEALADDTDRGLNAKSIKTCWRRSSG